MNFTHRLFALALLFAVSFAVDARSIKPCKKSHLRYRDLAAQAVTRVAPSYPNERGFRAAGKVIVLIEVDPHGDVISARVMCGHPLLAASSVAAAMRWKFQPRRVNGKHVKNIGIVTFVLSPESK